LRKEKQSEIKEHY